MAPTHPTTSTGSARGSSVPPDNPTEWKLVRFEEMFRRWVQIESPDEATQERVIAWIAARRNDPREGMRRETAFPNLWWGTISGTLDGAGTMVVCSYEILERTRVVRCMGINRVGLPV